MSENTMEISRLSVAIALLVFSSLSAQINRTFPNERYQYNQSSMELAEYVEHKVTQGDSIDNHATLVGRWADGPCYAVTGVDHIAYFGNGGYLEIVNIIDPANPVMLSKVLMSSVVRDIVISGSYAYVVEYNDGLQIFDISNPASPTKMGLINTGATSQGVVVNGTYAYVAAGIYGLRIFEN